ncbi:DegQ family serine endoprotease [Geminicoccus harenae]|uniref:DegQ family serine endoprotease n=1 Tax=Geminicoccus harenae TaxID=2498453 RepID=UPI00168B2F26|nr:DegQ family serine endoprotease [Geminicoccus harenae]
MMQPTVTRRFSLVRNLALCTVAAAALATGSVPALPAFAPSVAHAENYDRGYADLVARVMPSVVSVQVEGSAKGAVPASGQMDEQQRRFFERFFGQPFPQPEQRPQGKMEGLGSGFVIDPSGYIVTNAHVVGGADKIEVVFQDGDRLPAELVGIDPKTDLAVIKVESKEKLTALAWSDSDKVRVGDKVVAVGNPFGLGSTVTAGIVSATGREIGSGPYDDFIQVDAPINRGNSGGPTFDLDGNVIGVNSMIFSPSGGSVGIGFAISSNLAKSVTAELIENGSVERGWIGVGIQQMDEDLKSSFGLEDRSGALVSQVTPDGPAAKAGLRAGDVILSFDGHPIERLTQLTRAVADTDPGDAADVKIWRDGKEQTVSLEVGQMPVDQQVAQAETAAPAEQPRLGLALAPLTDEARQELGVPANVEGALVRDVMGGSPAEEKGIAQGDVIVSVGSEQVDGPQKVIDAVRGAAEDGASSVRLLVARGDAQRWVAVPFAAS